MIFVKQRSIKTEFIQKDGEWVFSVKKGDRKRMRNFEFTVKEEVGIHARPASQMVVAASAYKSSITIDKNGKKADAKRLLALMSLGVKCGDNIIFNIEGEDEDIAADQLVIFCNKNL